MPLEIIGAGPTNKANADYDQKDLCGKIVFKGERSAISIGRGCTARALSIEVGSCVEIKIERNCLLGSLQIYASGENLVTIGAGTGFNGRVRLLLHEPGAISIGKGGLIGGSSDFTISDMHSIIDVASRKRVNPAADIRVEEHVWIGEGAMILKGASIGKNSIVGARSVVTADVPSGTVVAGIPARVVRTGVTWRYDLI
jgi:acetyltransferase-like isoleucine patch superfamily enzyme